VCKWIRGKALGGSTVLNGGVYMRGLKKDYDNWAAMGNTGWSYKDVLPFFKKSENNLEEDFSSNTEFHNTGGPLKVSRQKFRTPAGEAWLQTGLENGYPVDDLNGPFQRGTFVIKKIIIVRFRCK
jgi:choline dehydrogenase-like flavoprotein